MACRHLQIEVTSRCNLSCITCLYGHYPERRVEADRVDTLYAKIINAPQHLRSDMPVLVRICAHFEEGTTPPAGAGFG